MTNTFNIEDIFIIPTDLIESKKDLFIGKETKLSELVNAPDVSLTDDVWDSIIIGMSSGYIKGYLDLQSKYKLSPITAMAIYSSGLIDKIHLVKTNEAKNKLLTNAVTKLEQIYTYYGDTDQAISAIDKLAKIVGITEKKADVNINNNVNLNIENILRAVKKDKGVIDI